ncbi:1,4-dihydroxy-2-naphthoyl-CoA synthase [Ottowia thiooxydans]|uniref:1,4-dihydroxy-2-naphthoyl-CoA synthase n=1 Tax=Ottowia thiooxydans TaxID=219182 RepID=A0ABV2QF62_9BURK
MMITGDRISGAEFYRRGIVETCVPADQLMPTAMEMARRIASKSPQASRTAKQATSTIEFMALRNGYRFEQNMTAELSKSDYSREAMRPFAEKWPPVFTGSRSVAERQQALASFERRWPSLPFVVSSTNDEEGLALKRRWPSP